MLKKIVETDVNTMTISVPSSPDSRFAGHIVINVLRLVDIQDILANRLSGLLGTLIVIVLTSVSTIFSTLTCVAGRMWYPKFPQLDL